ncbi:MAG TPA: 2-phospho-L-lactate transferase [Candidatus Methanoculleus thermohydrogenotrophicum]|jgi:LPPG:FO 2-phospho-L-lactate transferase|nr:2-phospho-L-lactate transferase [Candidatus Methanoculleus thermohydrogenotrophicum]NLM82381.1 2-phospho-L-lactate transferase [Candidatus Methanoculleus thermohydrogenotrophicum]HOB18872.1 2-phospho-L-lactate transferase [Candidatus Methanoculleus thermohydrogenotrophicum]HPZ38622.1 2-phospho-L-lactate transferase [Candidatus Methanoculleus thermohydrogenotrophicum]HQC91781.1 2-phospho-L-lactate transferase [Candidatus Methanoculleus thermohydrogenotrophicum]
MITFLSGGTGTPKLLRGMLDLLDERDIAVVVNTAEDIWLSGNHLSPDVDTVIYLFAGILDTERWWGIRDDTYITHDLLGRLGVEEFITIGDRDRAVHVARGEMLRGGMRLTEVTRTICERLGVRATVLPMTDSVVTTYVRTQQGEMHFQEYWVKHRGALAIEDVVRRSREPPVATPEVIEAIEASDAVVIGPSNPITSISPILECAGVREALRRHGCVIAVSPFIGDAPVSGPAAALMRASGREPSSAGTYALYEDFMDIFIQDTRDPVEIEGALRFDTLMVYRGKSLDLAKSIVTLIYGY